MVTPNSAVRDPTCPICKKALFGRVVWFPSTGNCHDSCVEPLVVEEIAARDLAPDDEA